MVSLGEMLSKVANEIFTDIKNMLLAMKNQDSELRTTVMNVLIVHSRKKLALCYSMIRWLSNVLVKQNLSCISDFTRRVSCVQDCVNQKLDELFFSHAAIYSMRNNPLKVDDVIDLITSGGSQLLPQAVFSCGFPSLPDLPEDTFTVLQELTLLISAKLSLCGTLCQQFMSVLDGVLTVRVPGSFEVFLSLSHLEPSGASWTVLGCRVLASNAPPRGCAHDTHMPDHSVLEARLVAIIADYIAFSSSSSSSIGSDTRPPPNESVSVGGTAPSSSTNGCASGVFSDDRILSDIVAICGHAAAAASLRLFYSQAVRAGSRWAGLMQVSFDEQSVAGVSMVKVLLWRSPLTRLVAPRRMRMKLSREVSCSAAVQGVPLEHDRHAPAKTENIDAAALATSATPDSEFAVLSVVGTAVSGRAS